MIGCDIAKIDRFANKSSRFINKVLTAKELVEFETKTNKAKYLASRWSAKESIFKATGIRNATVLNDENGRPYILNQPNLHVTISHDGDYVFTVAIDKRNG